MDATCTCGARLVEDALFCHRCGKPTREDLMEPEEAAEAALPVQEPLYEAQAEPVARWGVSFRSALAVRVGLLAAALVQLVLMAAAMARAVQLLPLILGAGGAYAVYLFIRRSGQGLTVIEGARLGWIVGVFTFAISTLLLTATLLVSGRGLPEMMEESFKTTGIDSGTADRALEMLRDPQFLVTFLVLMLVFNFLLVTVVCSLGGALGARLSRGKQDAAPPRA